MSFGSLPSVLGNGGGVAISVIGGRGLFADGTAAAPSISFSADPDTGFYRAAANQIRLALGGNGVYTFTSTGSISSTATGATLLLSDATGAISLTAAGTNQNITLTPSGTGVVNFSNGQILLTNGNSVIGSTGNIYLDAGGGGNILLRTGKTLVGTGALDSNNGVLQLATHTASTGGIGFGTDTSLYRGGSGNLKVSGPIPVFSLVPSVGTQSGFFTIVNSGGTTYIGCDNSTGSAFSSGAYSAILGSGSNSTVLISAGVRALTLDTSQNATFAGNILFANTASYLKWNGRGGLLSSGDGIIRLTNDANTDFNRLQFGGTTSSFPALARLGSTLQAVVADASAYCNFIAQSGSFTSLTARSAAATAGVSEVSYGGTTATTVGAAGAASPLPALPTGYIIVNVAGTNMKVPYFAN